MTFLRILFTICIIAPALFLSALNVAEARKTCCNGTPCKYIEMDNSEPCVCDGCLSPYVPPAPSSPSPSPFPGPAPVPATYTLTVEISHRGTVSVEPGGSFTCSTTAGTATRTFTLSSGTTVTVSATSLRYLECEEASCTLDGAAYHQWYDRQGGGWSESGPSGATTETVTMNSDKSIKVLMNGQCHCGGTPGGGGSGGGGGSIPPSGPPTGPCASGLNCADDVGAHTVIGALHIKNIHDDYVRFVTGISKTNRLALSSAEWSGLAKGSRISAKYLRDLQQAIQRTNVDLGNLIATLDSSTDVAQYEANKKGQVKRSHINHLCSDLKRIRAVYNGMNSCP